MVSLRCKSNMEEEESVEVWEEVGAGSCFLSLLDLRGLLENLVKCLVGR